MGDALPDIGHYRGSDKNILHITDKKTSFFNFFTPEFVLSKVEKVINGKKIMLSGSSLGGFNAIIFSNYIDSDMCLAFAPPYSINSGEFRVPPVAKPIMDRITDKKINTLRFSKFTKYRLIFGNDVDEQKSYSKAIPHCFNNDIDFEYLIFKKSEHNVMAFLKNNGFADQHEAGDLFLNNSMDQIKAACSHIETTDFWLFDYLNTDWR